MTGAFGLADLCVSALFCSQRCSSEAGRGIPAGWSLPLSDTCSTCVHRRQLNTLIFFLLAARIILSL